MRTHHPSFLSFCFPFLLGILLFSTGCPNKTTPPDGGETVPESTQTTEQSPLVTCDAGSTCLKVSDPAVRSCQVIFEIPSDKKAENLAFSDQVRGRTMQKTGRLGIVFFVREDKALEQPAASFTSLNDTKILQQTCYDGNGRPLEKATILLEKK